MSATELAHAVGVTSGAVSNWENNPERAPARKHLSRIAEVLDLKYEQLLTPSTNPLQPDEQRVLTIFRLLDAPERAFVLKMLEGLKRK